MAVARATEAMFDVQLIGRLPVNCGQRWDETNVAEWLEPEPVAVPKLDRSAVQLSYYDQLLAESAHDPV